MSRRLTFNSVRVMLACVSFCLLVSAGDANVSVAQPQQQQPQARGSAPSPPPAPSKLVLSVTHYPDAAPSYLSLPGTAWYAGFARIKDFQLPAGALPVRAVDILAQTEGDQIKITVSVILGVRFHDKKEEVVTYLARNGDAPVVIADLRRYGVEPFKLDVVPVTPDAAVPPAISNKTTSISVIGIKPLDTPLPSYQLTFHNSSGKQVVSLALNLFADGKVRTSSQPHNLDGRTLIEPGGTYKRGVRLAQRTQPAGVGFAPNTIFEQTLEISCVVFRDHTYEGDAGFAARIITGRRGKEAQVRRIIHILQQVQQAPTDEEAAALFVRLHRAVEDQLLTTSDAATTRALQAESPTRDDKILAELPIGFEVSMHITKQTFQKTIADFQSQQPKPEREAVRKWLRDTQQEYEEMLARFD